MPVDGVEDEPTTRPWAPQAVAPPEVEAVSDADGPPLVGTSRSDEPRICPFLRLEQDGVLSAPLDVVSDQHLCVAFGEPRPQSERQQELLCLQAAHSNCARYLRGVAKPEAVATGSRIPRATVAAVIVLLASVGFSFGFVLQRGGLELAGFQLPSRSAAASVAGPSATTIAAASPSVAAVVPGASSGPVAAATGTPAPTGTPGPTPSPSLVATASPTPAPRPSASPVVTPVVTPASTPAPTPRRTATPRPTSDRFAVITRCPGRRDCWIYTIRTGDNLFSIAHWFGVSLDRIYAMNPWAQTRGIRPGNELLIPTPTR